MVLQTPRQLMGFFRVCIVNPRIILWAGVSKSHNDIQDDREGKRDVGGWRCYTSAVCELPFCLDKSAHRVPWDSSNQKRVVRCCFLKAMCVSPPALFFSLPMFSRPLRLKCFNSSTLFSVLESEASVRCCDFPLFLKSRCYFGKCQKKLTCFAEFKESERINGAAVIKNLFFRHSESTRAFPFCG